MNTLNSNHSLIIKKCLKCLNTYSSIQTTSSSINGFNFSLVDIQILNAFYPNKVNQYNMTTISSELGIAASTFSKSVSKLTNLGLLEKYHKKSNKKNVIVWLSEKGENYITELMKCYSNSLNHFVESLDCDPLREKYYLEFLELLESHLCPTVGNVKLDEPLIPIN